MHGEASNAATRRRSGLLAVGLVLLGGCGSSEAKERAVDGGGAGSSSGGGGSSSCGGGGTLDASRPDTGPLPPDPCVEAGTCPPGEWVNVTPTSMSATVL